MSPEWRAVYGEFAALRIDCNSRNLARSGMDVNDKRRILGYFREAHLHIQQFGKIPLLEEPVVSIREGSAREHQRRTPTQLFQLIHRLFAPVADLGVCALA